MAEVKTKVDDASVAKFLDAIMDEQVREDCWAIVDMMRKATQDEPRMWGTSIVGFGSYHYKYASGHEGDSPRIGFSPRKGNIALCIMCGFKIYDELMTALGKHTRGKSCLYIKRLSDVHVPIRKKLTKASVQHMNAAYPPEKRAKRSV